VRELGPGLFEQCEPDLPPGGESRDRVSQALDERAADDRDRRGKPFSHNTADKRGTDDAADVLVDNEPAGSRLAAAVKARAGRARAGRVVGAGVKRRTEGSLEAESDCGDLRLDEDDPRRRAVVGQSRGALAEQELGEHGGPMLADVGQQ